MVIKKHTKYEATGENEMIKLIFAVTVTMLALLANDDSPKPGDCKICDMPLVMVVEPPRNQTMYVDPLTKEAAIK